MITIKTDKSQLQIFPQFGGVLADLQLFNGQKTIAILDSYQSIDDIEAKNGYKSHFLLPFPNRLNDGKYTFDGKDYQFPINDLSNRHNLHGFLETIPVEITHQISTKDQSVIELTGDFKGLSYYPFSFRFIVQYTLTHSELTIKVTIENKGKTRLPMGFGWHPYFILDSKNINDLTMQLPDCQTIEINQRMIPTGKTNHYSTFLKPSKINHTRLDNCFIINNLEEEKAIISLQSETTILQIWQKTDAFPYFQIYTPDHRKSIAIEPMTCNVDAFNNKEGLSYLGIGEKRTMEFGIDIKAI